MNDGFVLSLSLPPWLSGAAEVPAITRSFLVLQGGVRGGGRYFPQSGVSCLPGGRTQEMSERSDSEADGAAGPHTDFDSLFVIGEADQSVLVAKQQQQVEWRPLIGPETPRYSPLIGGH